MCWVGCVGLDCGPEDKINLGGTVLQSLLREWQKVINLEEHRRTHTDDASKTDEELIEKLHQTASANIMAPPFVKMAQHS